MTSLPIVLSRAICESFLHEIGGHGIFWWQHQRALRESFLHINLIFCQFAKVFSLDSFPLYVSGTVYAKPCSQGLKTWTPNLMQLSVDFHLYPSLPSLLTRRFFVLFGVVLRLERTSLTQRQVLVDTDGSGRISASIAVELHHSLYSVCVCVCVVHVVCVCVCVCMCVCYCVCVHMHMRCVWVCVLHKRRLYTWNNYEWSCTVSPQLGHN